MDHVSATVNSVGAVAAGVAIGALTSHTVPTPQVTVKDFSLMITGICVPCLLFEKMASAFTADMLSAEAAVLMSFAALATLVGSVCGYGLGAAVVPECSFLTMVGGAFQNTVVLPVGMITALTVPWLTDAVRAQAIALVFVYNITNTASFWVIGNALIQRAADKLHGRPERRRAEGESAVTHYARIAVTALWTPQLIATLLGMACGLLELEKKRGGQGYAFNVVFGATRMVGSAVIPGSLFLLGCNLRRTTQAPQEDPARQQQQQQQQQQAPAHGESQTQEVESQAAVSGPAVSPSAMRRLIACMIAVRLVAVPAVCIAVFHFIVRGWFGFAPSRAMVLVLFTELAAPTAIAVSLICNLHNYLATEFARAVSVQYMTVIVTATAWLTFTLWYIDEHVAAP